MTHYEISKQFFKDFFFAGKAEFTAHNERSGNRVTYYINKSSNRGYKEDVHFVSCRVLGDEYNGKVFIGTIYKKSLFIHHKRSTLRSNDVAVKAVQWFIDNFHTLENGNMSFFKLYHVGNCCKCGRKLTHPDSIVEGIGPECGKNISKRRSSVKLNIA